MGKTLACFTESIDGELQVCDVIDEDELANSDDLTASDGVFKKIGELPECTPVTEHGLAGLLGVHPLTIKRCVARRELPQPARLCGKPVWIIGSIIRHLEKMMEYAAGEADLLKSSVRGGK